jgi:protein-S-isoprenylcysteine O-methyltransferase Ste14
MIKHAAHTRSWQTAETILVIPLLLSLILGYLFPLPLSELVPRAASISAGVILLLIGFTIISITRREFRQAGQPTDPGHPTTQLIQTGIFAWSRNPLYLAGVVIFMGLAALFNSLWLLILFVPTVAAIHFVLIVPEERYLEAKFGEQYRQYAMSVRRWVGRRKYLS